VQASTILTDAIMPLRGRDLPPDIPIVLERRFLGNDYTAGLIFQNADAPFTISPGSRYPTFPIVGRADDIRRFWDTFYTRANNPAILAVAANGNTINPAQFVYDNVLYPKAQFYYINAGKTGNSKLPGINTRLLRGLLPPGVLFSLLIGTPRETFTDTRCHLTGEFATGISLGRLNIPMQLTIHTTTPKSC
jgi:hypothetical protein